LRRHPGTQRRHHRQPLLSFRAELLRARLRRRQEDQGIHLAKYGFPLAINISPANTHDSKGIVPVLHQLAGRGFKGTALGDLSYRGQRLSKAGEALGITLQPSAGGHGGTFIPEGIRWVVERSLAWISRYRRLNTIFERTPEHLVAFIEIAFISILSRRLVRLVTQEISA
jgi:EAL domain-containing protein (putative c-di-GMP-specific phosphodiesterase class I)